MKTKNAALLAAAMIGSLWASNASAQFAAGDLMLGVRSTSVTSTNLVFDLGSASTIASGTSAIDLSGDLSYINGAFGSLNNLYFSVFGYVDAADAGTLGYAANTVFLAKLRSSPYVTGTDPNVGIAPSLSLSQSAQGTVLGWLEAIATGAQNGTVLASGIAGIDSSLNLGGDVSYLNGIKNPANTGVAGNVHGTWNRYPVEAGTGAAFSTGGTAISLDIYQQNPGSANLGAYLGTLTLDPSGTLSLIPTDAPEPTTFAMFGSGLLALTAIRRLGRKNIN